MTLLKDLSMSNIGELKKKTRKKDLIEKIII